MGFCVVTLIVVAGVRYHVGPRIDIDCWPVRTADGVLVGYVPACLSSDVERLVSGR